jgi:hypothetical protein
MQDEGYGIPDTRYRIPDTRYEIPVAKYLIVVHPLIDLFIQCPLLLIMIKIP